MLGLAAAPTADDISGFLANYPAGTPPPASDVAGFLKMYTGDDRQTAAQELVTAGVDPATVTMAMSFLSSASVFNSKIWIALATISAIASGYHGVRRHNGSVLYGLLWFTLGGIFPVITPTIAIAQGFGEPQS